MRRKNQLILCALLLLFFLMPFTLQAQEFGFYSNDGYNDNSIRPIHDSHIAYKKTIWRRWSMKERQNRSFMAVGNEMPDLLIKATKMGVIRPYENDSLKTRMSLEDFKERIRISSEVSPDLDADLWLNDGDDPWKDIDAEWTDNQDQMPLEEEYFPKDLYIVEMKIDVLFDKKRGRMIQDIQSISIIIPAEMNPMTGLEKPIATFSYKELVQNVFKDNQNALWYNERNAMAHLNLDAAFDLMLFNSRIIKYHSTRDEYIIDIYDDAHQALIAQQQYQSQLIEYENNLWEN